MTREIALKIVAVAALLIGCASVAVVAAKQNKTNNPTVVMDYTAVVQEEKTPKGCEQAALSDKNHFVILFAYDPKSAVLKPAKSHVFALFYETKNGALSRDFSINWSTTASQFRPGLTVGKNYDVKETLIYATKNDYEVQMWGPYSVDEKFYKNAELRFNDLQAGKYYYRTADSLNRTDLNVPAVNNVHAVSDIAGCIDTEGKYGKAAAAVIVKKFSANDVVSQQNYGRDTCHDELIKNLGLTIRPMTGRK